AEHPSRIDGCVQLPAIDRVAVDERIFAENDNHGPSSPRLSDASAGAQVEYCTALASPCIGTRHKGRQCGAQLRSGRPISGMPRLQSIVSRSTPTPAPAAAWC